MKRHVFVAFLLAAMFSLVSLSCSVLQQAANVFANLQRCQFKLAGVSDFNLAGVPLSGKTSFSVQDGLKLLPAFQQKQFPAKP